MYVLVMCVGGWELWIFCGGVMEVVLYDVYERVRFFYVICERFSVWELVGGSYGSFLEELKFFFVKFFECFLF